MYRDLTISVVIPCYNEEDGVQRVIKSLPGSVDEVVVVDNNSTDRTA
ncbi:MAG: glycosyltransferase, partial [bacterium]